MLHASPGPCRAVIKFRARYSPGRAASSFPFLRVSQEVSLSTATGQ